MRKPRIEYIPEGQYMELPCRACGKFHAKPFKEKRTVKLDVKVVRGRDE